MAILTALFTGALLMGLGLSIALVGTTESTLAAHDHVARELRQASIAAAHLAIADLRRKASWSAVVAPGAVAPYSASPGQIMDAALTPPAPWGGPPLDLRALTAEVHAAADMGSGDPQAWRLFEAGSLERPAPGTAAGHWYIATWVADDWADGDGDPSVDVNGRLVVWAMAFGPGGAAMTTVVSLKKTAVAGEPDRIEILVIRPAG